MQEVVVLFGVVQPLEHDPAGDHFDDRNDDEEDGGEPDDGPEVLELAAERDGPTRVERVEDHDPEHPAQRNREGREEPHLDRREHVHLVPGHREPGDDGDDRRDETREEERHRDRPLGDRRVLCAHARIAGDLLKALLPCGPGERGGFGCGVVRGIGDDLAHSSPPLVLLPFASNAAWTTRMYATMLHASCSSTAYPYAGMRLDPSGDQSPSRITW